jgi:hypothetical protein
MGLATHALLRAEVIDFHDHVRVPDGRTGEVIGFYRREDESIVVLFPCGDSAEFPTVDVEHCT